MTISDNGSASRIKQRSAQAPVRHQYVLSLAKRLWRGGYPERFNGGTAVSITHAKFNPTAKAEETSFLTANSDPFGGSPGSRSKILTRTSCSPALATPAHSEPALAQPRIAE